MKKRVKLFTTIASLCLAVALMAFGVYAAANVTYNVNGTVSYVMTDVLVNVSTKLEKSTTVVKKAVEGTDVTAIKAEAGTLSTVKEEPLFTTINADGAANDEVFDAAVAGGKGTKTLTGYTYNLAESSIYILTIKVETTNAAGVNVTPTFTEEVNDAYEVVASHTAVEKVEKGAENAVEFVFCVVLRDVTKQVPENTTLNFTLEMAQA